MFDLEAVISKLWIMDSDMAMLHDNLLLITDIYWHFRCFHFFTLSIWCTVSLGSDLSLKIDSLPPGLMTYAGRSTVNRSWIIWFFRGWEYWMFQSFQPLLKDLRSCWIWLPCGCHICSLHSHFATNLKTCEFVSAHFIVRTPKEVIDLHQRWRVAIMIHHETSSSYHISWVAFRQIWQVLGRNCAQHFRELYATGCGCLRNAGVKMVGWW